MCTISSVEMVLGRWRAMRVGVNLLWCRPGRVGGSEEYLVRQLRGLATVAPDVSARLLVPPGFAAAHADLAGRFDVVTVDRMARFRPARIVAEDLVLPRYFADVDVIHHGGGTMALRNRVPTVLTVHDVQYLHEPQNFSLLRRTYLSHRVPAAVGDATVIAVPSEFVATALVEELAADRSRIFVVPHGYDPPPRASLPDHDALRERYGLGARRLIVYPAITHPHKGHRLLIELLAGPWADRDLALVLLGGAGAADSAVAEAIAGSGVGDRVVRPGRVPAADRDGLIAIAEALVFPSYYEGFGAPVLEAMALGTPVVCSDRGALPEVAGDAAVVLPPTVDAWSGALATVAGQRDELIARGRRRAAALTVAASGTALASAYRRAHGERAACASSS
jgi:alpha-1,3-rhamnosyl/mannosyltransferase